MSHVCQLYISSAMSELRGFGGFRGLDKISEKAGFWQFFGPEGLRLQAPAHFGYRDSSRRRRALDMTKVEFGERTGFLL